MVHLTRQLNTATLPNAQVDDHYEAQKYTEVLVSKQSVPDMPYASYDELKHAERVRDGQIIDGILNRLHCYEFMT